MKSRTNPAGDAAQFVRASAAADREAAIERQLRWRMGLAGSLILVLSATLPLLDYLAPLEDAASASPQYTEPVPVRRKDPPPLPPAPSPADTPTVVPVIAEPQATGAAIEASLASTETPSAPVAGLAADTPVATADLPSRLRSGPRLQTSLLADGRRAEELQASLAQAGIPASVETRLQVGPFRTRTEAEAARREIQKRGIDAVILPGHGDKP